MRLKPGTTNAEARAAAAAFNKRQEAYRERQRAMNSGAGPGAATDIRNKIMFEEQIRQEEARIMQEQRQQEARMMQEQQRLRQQEAEMRRQAEMQRRPVDRGPGSGGAPGYNPKTGNYDPSGGKVKTPQRPPGISVGVPGSHTYKERPFDRGTGNYVPPRPGMGPPPEQINPSQPNVMGFPDMPTQQQSAQYQDMMQQMMRSGGLGGQPLGVAPFGMGRPGGPVNTGGLGQGGMSSVNTTTQSDIMGGNRRPMGGFNPADMMQGLQQLAGRNNPPQMGGRPLTPRPVPPFALANQSPQGPTKPMGGLGQGGMSPFNTTTQSDIMGGDRRPPGGFNAGNIMQGLQSVAARNNPQASSPAAPAFKKGGKVTAKAAPVKKAAGGKVAAKAPVKKAMGGKVAAKPMAKPVAKKAKPMAKPMSAMKRGGKVMAKGRYK